MQHVFARRSRRGFFALTAILAVATGFSVSSAAAAGDHTRGVGCVPAGFDSIEALASARAGGNVVKEPTITEPAAALPESAKGKGNSRFRATIPVYFHVVSPDGVVGNVSQAKIDEQIAVLSLAFGGFYGGANTNFKFRLAGVTRTVNADWYDAGPGSPAERAMKKALRRGGWDTLNYYSTTAGPYLGWAYLPGLPASRQYLDGIVVDWESMPHTSSAYADRYDLGYTAVHEAGHWLGLEHTFYGGCNAKGDYVADTPAQRYPTSGCPIGNDTCPEPGVDPIHNFMDYSYDSCYFEFTPGQGARMQDHYLFFRAGK